MKQVIEHGVLRGKFKSIVDRMGANLKRSGGSRTLITDGDYSCSLLDRDQNLMATNNVAHVSAAVRTADRIIDEFEFDMREGDVFLHNDPYNGGTHTADVSAFTPIVYDTEIAAYAVVRTRVPDFAGRELMSHTPDANMIFEEGYRITPIKVEREGKRDHGLFESIGLNTRVVESERVINSAIAASKIGKQLYTEVVDRYGVETVENSVTNAIEYANNIFSNRVENWPSGEYAGESRVRIEDDTYEIAVVLTVGDDEIEIDCTGVREQASIPINSPVSSTEGFATVPIVGALGNFPLNQAIRSNIEITTSSGTLLDPVHPAPISFSKRATGPAVSEAVTDALVDVVPETVGNALSKQGYIISHPPTRKYDEERDAVVAEPIEDESNVIDLSGYFMEKSSGFDGGDGWGIPSYAARGKSPSVEVLEQDTPGYVEKMEYEADTAGPGRWRGAPATRVEGRFDGDLDVIGYVPDSATQAFLGGEEGASHALEVNQEEIVGLERTRYKDTFLISMIGGGGGGYGDPLERDSENVLRDFQDGLVTREGAKDDYGVIIDPDDRSIDERATEEQRQKRDGGPTER